MEKTQQLTRIKRIAASVLEALFLALTGVYLICRFSTQTTFGLSWPAGFSKKLLTFMAITAALRLLSTRLIRWKTITALALALVYYMAYRSNGYRFLLFLGVLTVGLIDIDYRKILKTFLIAVGTFYCVTVIAGMTGAITNYVRIKDGLRSSWGICYPTDFATFTLFLALTLWVACAKLPDWAMLFACLGSVLLTRLIAHSVTSFTCSVLFFCAIIYCIFERRVLAKRSRLAWVGKGVNLLVTVAFPLCAIAMFGLIIGYARGINVVYRINNLMTNRLQYALESWQKHGVKPFGTHFFVSGNGFSNFPPANYTFIDSTYPLILIRYGWVLLLTLCLSWGWTARKAIRCGDRRLLLALGIIAIHSFSEHHFIEPHVNIFLVMPLAAYGASQDRASEDAKGHPATLGGKTMLSIAITALLCGGVAYLTAPALLSRLKTVLEVKGLCGGKTTAWALIGVIFALLCVVAAFVWAVKRLIRAALTRKPIRSCRPALAILTVCIAAGCGAQLYANHAIDGAVVENAALVESDREALEIATNSATGKVYSGILPAVYARSVDGLSYSAFFGDDLARHRGTTALMESKSEHSAFFDSGCLYVQISDKHALYTSDRSVIEALSAAGYHLTGYYSNVRTVSLSKAAKNNKLTYTKEDGLKLKGKKKVLKSGPYYNLYGGKYTVTYELSLPQDAVVDEGLYCTLSVTTYKGKNTLLKKKIMGTQFDEDGILTVSIPFTISDSKNVAFTAKTAEGRTVYIRSIRFARTPDYDVHHLYDSRLREVRVEYYTLEGEPTDASGGYFAIEKEYDGAKNVNRQRYYNRDNELTLCTSGYAELYRVYNARRKIIREEYYGTDGAPIALTSRAAANEREYDGEGNAIVNRYYGVDGQPVITTSGYAELHREFDKDRHVVRESYYGIEGEPIPLSAGQYAIEQEFDKNGNVTVRRFYGEDGEQKLRTDGYAEVHWKYNGMRQIIREDFYDAEGQPVEISNKYAADEREYDDAGNVTVYRYYGTDGAPVKIKSGYAELHRRYNSQRKVIREEYYGVDGQPIALSAGQYAIENEYDDVGNVSIRRFYGEDGRPVLRTDGYAEVHWQYNGMRQVTREEFYGTDGQPIAMNTGAAANEREYDGAGNISVYRYYDTEGQPTVITSGYAELHRTYNDKRQIIREDYFGTDGAPMVQPEGHCSVEQEYDSRGNIVVQRYYDGDGQPIIITSGYAEVHRVYNGKKQMIREEYFDVDGSPYVRAAGHTAIEQEFDDNGELAVRRYLDAQGDAMQRIDGYAEARWIRDEESGVRNVSFYDLKGNEIPLDGLNLVLDAPDGWSRWYTPKTDTTNITFKIATANIGKAAIGCSITCQIEVEFEGVAESESQAFAFYSLGMTDGVWKGYNFWNKDVIDMKEAPEDDIYGFIHTQQLEGKQMNIETFNIGFRCDNWAKGKFRIRDLKIGCSSEGSVWSPGI